MTAAWCLPVVDLLLRCQLSVLGRHLYYAARTGGGGSTHGYVVVWLLLVWLVVG